MASFTRFEDFEIWQLSRLLYQKTVKLIKNNIALSKDFSLKDQMKRSSGSVMDNFAEGFGRGGNAEFVYFLSISNGSVSEYKSQLYRSIDGEYISKIEFDDLFELADKISKKITAFIQYLNKSGIKGEKFRKNKVKSIVEEPMMNYERIYENFEQNDNKNSEVEVRS